MGKKRILSALASLLEMAVGVITQRLLLGPPLAAYDFAIVGSRIMV